MEKNDCDTSGNHQIDQSMQSTKLAMDKAVIGHGDSDKTRDKVCQDKSGEDKKEVPPQKKIKKKHTKASHVKKTQNQKPRTSNQFKRMFDPHLQPRRPSQSTSSSYYTSSDDS